MIGLVLELPPLRLGFAERPDNRGQDLPPDEQERFVQRAMKRCSRQGWLVKSQQDQADAVVTLR